MSSLFVFTAGSAEAQAHLDQSIRRSIPAETVFAAFSPDQQQTLEAIQRDGEGFYAWVAAPGPQNESRWERMAVGDWVLCVYGGTYRYVARVLGKLRSPAFASAVWGKDPDGQTWEYVYFLTKPTEVNAPVAKLGEDLNEDYRGFTRISDAKAAGLIQRYGSLEDFMSTRLTRSEPGPYLLLRSNVGSKWQDEEAASYHYGTTVPNYTKLVPGTPFLLDRKFPEGTRIIGRGRLGEIVDEPGANEGQRHFRAVFSEYQPLKPSRLMTPDVQEKLRSMSGYNVQHAIRLISPELFEELGRPARAWIFQADPKTYDVRAAVRRLRIQDWIVTAYKDEISPGDRVYVWEAGSNSGIVAVADVLDQSSVRRMREETRPFLRDASFPDEHLRVDLGMRMVVEPSLSRWQLQGIAPLENLSILRQAQGTNFAVLPEEAEIIEDLLNRQPRVVKIAPGRDARFWDDCHRDGYICVGWDEIGDLRAYDDFAEYREVFRQREGGDSPASHITRKARELWTLRELVPGDRVVANRGTREVLAVGTVIEPAYEWRPERPEYKHTVRVEWDTSVAKLIPEQPTWATTTVAPVPDDVFAMIMGRQPTTQSENAYRALLDVIEQSGLHFPVELVANYLLALQTRRFVILPGISGTGKTRLAMAVADHFDWDDEQGNHVILAVRPDWTDNRGLLGYLSPITNEYVTTPLLRLLLRARREIQTATQEGREPRPFFVVLDEMNLARVEHYFSDFLSCLESGEPLDLHSGLPEHVGGIPRRLEIPSNIFFTGTVNIDETTYMFSPKVLDRAFTIELGSVDLVSYGAASRTAVVGDTSPLYLGGFPGSLSVPRPPSERDWIEFSSLLGGQLRQIVVELNTVLAGSHRRFGYRVAN